MPAVRSRAQRWRSRIPYRSTRCVSVHAVKSEGEAGRWRDVSAVALNRVKYGKPFSGSGQYVRKPFKDFAQL